MKKFVNVFLCLAIFAITCLFAGCTGTPQSYRVDVNVLHAHLGSVVGGNGVYQQGSTVTIKAVPSTSSTTQSTFVAWLGNNKVVSTDEEYTFEVNSETAGEYIALFACPYMEYISVDNFSVNIQNDANATIKLKNVQIYLGSHNNLVTKAIDLTMSTLVQIFLLTKQLFMPKTKCLMRTICKKQYLLKQC